MKCPICHSNLITTQRQGVEIDYCPHYCGVWLDRGELEKIIERSTVMPQRDDDGEDDNGYDRDRQDTGDRSNNHHPKRRRKSLLDDIFDFD